MMLTIGMFRARLCPPLRAAALGGALVVVAGAGETAAEEWVDLTHPFNAETVYWPTAKMFEKETVFAGRTDGGYYYSAFNFAAAEHGGTHIDAPVHFAQGALSVDRLPLEQLIGEGVVVDVTAPAAKNADYLVTVADLEAHERRYGRIPQGAIVLLNTGRAGLYPDRERYMGTAERGEDAIGKLHFPGLSKEGAEFLVERRIGAVGIDTPSIDYGQSKTFEAHVTLMTNNIPAFENVADMSLLPPTGATIIALPMKIEGGSGGPLRIVARLPNR